MSIPDFKDGVLPQKDYAVTFKELERSILVHGTNESNETWDTVWRLQLVKNCQIMAEQLWTVGIENIFLDGSFVEDKDHPNDIDGYFECDFDLLASGELQRELNLLDDGKIWTWAPESRRSYKGYPKKQLPMWHKYRIELYPHTPGLMSGIRDKFGNDLEFPAAFRISRRDDKPKGIIKLLKVKGA